MERRSAATTTVGVPELLRNARRVLLPVFPQVEKCWCKKVTSNGVKKRRDDIDDFLISYVKPEAGSPPYSH